MRVLLDLYRSRIDGSRKCVQPISFLFFFFLFEEIHAAVKERFAFYEAARAIPAVSFRSPPIVTDILYSRETNYTTSSR